MGLNQVYLLKSFLKFIFSKKATKIDEIFTVDLTLSSKCQMTVKISSIFEAFLENPNFTLFDSDGNSKRLETLSRVSSSI